MPDRDAEIRFQAVVAEAGLDPRQPPQVTESNSNDTWMIDCRHHGEVILRVCWRGDIQRLPREAAVARELPPEVGYPAVIADSVTRTEVGEVSWTLVRKLSGKQLIDVWPSLSDDQRRKASSSFARRLQALHAWSPPVELHGVIAPEMTIDLNDSVSIIGASIHPLPIDRLLAFVDLADHLEKYDSGLVHGLRHTIDELADFAPTFDDPSTSGVIHGDLHLANVWWDGEHVAGLIDLEWVRFAPPWVDIARVHDNADADSDEGSEAHVQVLTWLREDYPALFEVGNLDQRLRFLQLAFTLRETFIWSIPNPGNQIRPDHPIERLRRLVSGERSGTRFAFH